MKSVDELNKKTELFSESERYVTILFDEMKIQEDLVWDKHTGELIGFVDLGDMKLNYASVVATHILVFLVKSVVNPLSLSFILFLQGKSGNLTISISDHLAQFLIIPLDIGYVPKKINLYKRDTKNFDRENFFLDLISIDWDAMLKLENENPNQSFNDYSITLNTLVDKYMPLRKVYSITLNTLVDKYMPLRKVYSITLNILVDKYMPLRKDYSITLNILVDKYMPLRKVYSITLNTLVDKYMPLRKDYSITLNILVDKYMPLRKDDSITLNILVDKYMPLRKVYSITLNTLVDKYMPLRKVTLKEIKQQIKPWIKKEILSSIRKREKFYTTFIKAKDKVIKEEYHKKYKELRNQILNQCRQ